MSIAYAFDIRVARHGTLLVRFVVFRKRSGMVSVMRKAFKGQSFPASALGCCTESPYENTPPEVVCVVMLAEGHLSFETIVHESVHAALRYAERSRKTWGGPCEERICYPAGILANAAVKALTDKGFKITF